MMIRTAICDDEAHTRAYLAALVQSQPWDCEIVEYASAAQYLADRREIDLLFLDIRLDPSGTSSNGMALARKIREQDPAAQPVLIFVTGYDQYVFDAFDVGAFQYLLKPIDEEKFARAFARAAEEIASRRERPRQARGLTLQSAGASRTVPLDSIYYIESSNHKAVLHLKEGTAAYYAKIGDLESELRGRFFRIHKGYLVNLSYVAGYSRTEAFLASGETLPLSKYKTRDFVKAYLRFLKKETRHG